MIALVDQELGDVDGVHAMLQLPEFWGRNFGESVLIYRGLYIDLGVTQDLNRTINILFL